MVGYGRLGRLASSSSSPSSRSLLVAATTPHVGRSRPLVLLLATAAPVCSELFPALPTTTTTTTTTKTSIFTPLPNAHYLLCEPQCGAIVRFLRPTRPSTRPYPPHQKAMEGETAGRARGRYGLLSTQIRAPGLLGATDEGLDRSIR